MIKIQFISIGLSLLLSFVFACSSSNKIEENESNVRVLSPSSNVEPFYGIGYKAPYIPDEVYFAGERVPIEDDEVKERLDRELVVNNFWHSNTLFYLKKANRWFPVLQPILEEEGVPVDFLYLAVIESGLMQVTSPSGAKGIWQFMPSTAKEYDLKVTPFVDERMHIEKSTRAACQYLKKAYAKFGSWTLAAAAYNRGSAGILADQQRQQMTDFYDLLLNTETSRYVFRIIAAKIIMSNPKEYGFLIDDAQLYAPYELKKVWVKEGIDDLATWAIHQGINYKLLKRFNPWLIQSSLPVLHEDSLAIKLPINKEQYKVFTGL